MEKEQRIIEQIKEQGVLPLFYHPDRQLCVDVVKALYRAGIRNIEFTNRGAEALENFSALIAARNASMPDLLLAVGTIKSAADAEKFIAAGADYLISPFFDAAVCDAAYMQKIFWVPGCMTPTEVHEAEKAGCRLIKLFPGNVLEPGFVAAIKDLFPKVLFMPTGGVEPTDESLRAWFKAGVCAVGMGSKLISKKILEENDTDSLQTETLMLLELIRNIRK